MQDVIRGLNEPNQIEIRVDGVRVGQFTLGGGAELAAQAAADYRDVKAGTLTNRDDALQVRVPVKAGSADGVGHDPQVRTTSSRRDWARLAFRSGAAKATSPTVPGRPSRRC